MARPDMPGNTLEKPGNQENRKTGKQENRKTGKQENRKTGKQENRRTMMRRAWVILLAAGLVLASTVTAYAKGGRAGSEGVVYVTSQGLYYDTFVAADPLPMKGPFQFIANGETEFGPGDPGYLGGRWWEDLNGNGIQDEGDHFFLCPLLGPGRPTP